MENLHKKYSQEKSVWWNIDGIIQHELLKANQTVTGELCCQQLDRVCDALAVEYAALVNGKGVILHPDNARPHASKVTQQKMKQLGWELLPHPAYSPDITASDYHLFRSMTHYLILMMM